MMTLAQMYGAGQGSTANKFEATNWYRIAADAGIADAQFTVGTHYARGEGVAQRLSEAAKRGNNKTAAVGM